MTFPPARVYKRACAGKGLDALTGMTGVLRFIGSFFGGIFTTITLGLLFGALTLGAVFWMYSADLPSHDSLAQYSPPTISRIYSGEGRIIDEFAKERRLFVPIEDIPVLVRDAFISAEDKHFYTHKGYDVQGMISAAWDAIKSGGKNARGASTITRPYGSEMNELP